MLWLIIKNFIDLEQIGAFQEFVVVLGKYFKIDSNILRLIVVVITFMTAFTPIILYIIGSYIIPEEPR